MSLIVSKMTSAISVPTPLAGQITIFVDSSDGTWKAKYSDGSINPMGSGLGDPFVGDLLTVQNALSTLQPGRKVFVTDATLIDVGLLLTVVSDGTNNRLSPNGEAICLNADLGGIGTYSGVFNETGINVNSLQGVWRRNLVTLDYYPVVNMWFRPFSGMDFLPGDIVNVSYTDPEAELPVGFFAILDFGNTLAMYVNDTSGMSIGDAILFKDSGNSVLQAGMITTIVNSTKVIVGSLSGNYLDASLSFDHFEDVTQAFSDTINNMFYNWNVINGSNVIISSILSYSNTRSGDVAYAANPTNDAPTFYNHPEDSLITNINTGSTGYVVRDTILGFPTDGSVPAKLVISVGSSTDWDDLDAVVCNGGVMYLDGGSPATAFIYDDGDIVISDNGHYQVIDRTQFDGTTPANNTDAYYYLDKSIPNLGYILKVDTIRGFDLDNNIWSFRVDEQNKTTINYASAGFHQWGDPGISINQESSTNIVKTHHNTGIISYSIDSPSDLLSVVDFRYNTGIISGKIIGPSNVNYSSNNGIVNHDEISNGFNGTLALDQSKTRTYNKFSANDQAYYHLPRSYNFVDGEQLTNKFSDFEISIDPTILFVPANTFVFGVGTMVFPSNLKAIGSFRLTSGVYGSILLQTPTGPFTPGNTLEIEDSNSDLVCTAEVVSHNLATDRLIFKYALLQNITGGGPYSASDGTETAVVDPSSGYGALWTNTVLPCTTREYTFYMANQEHIDVIYDTLQFPFFGDYNMLAGGAITILFISAYCNNNQQYIFLYMTGRSTKLLSDSFTIRQTGLNNFTTNVNGIY